MIYTYDQITTVHLEITSKCNASCPMCGRNVQGGSTIKSLPLVELSISQIKSIFSEYGSLPDLLYLSHFMAIYVLIQ